MNNTTKCFLVTLALVAGSFNYGWAMQAPSSNDEKQLIHAAIFVGNREQMQLIHAIFEGDSATVARLLEAGININAQGLSGGTALMAASFCGKTEIVRMLLAVDGINVNAQDNKNGDTALMRVARSVFASPDINLSCAIALINAGADITLTNKYGKTALDIASDAARRTGNSKIANLLKRAIVPNARLLINAASVGDSATVARLLETGVNVNVQGLSGETALIEASLSGKTEIVRMLLDKGAHVNAQDDNGYTALMFALLTDHIEIVRMLLAVDGINVNVQDKNGDTALMLVAGSIVIMSPGDNLLCAIALIRAGADITLTNKYGETALDMVQRTSNSKTANLLKKVIVADEWRDLPLEVLDAYIMPFLDPDQK